MKEVFRTIKLLLKAIVGGAEKVESEIQSSDVARKYLYGIAGLATLSILLPLLIGVAGIIKGWLWLVGCAGLLSVAFLFPLLMWVAPIGIIIDSLLRILDFGPKEGLMGIIESFFKGEKVDLIRGERYVRLARGAMLWVAVTYLLFGLIPFRNRPELLPLYVLCTVCIILMGYQWKMGGHWLKLTLYYGSITLVGLLTIACFLPSLTLPNILTWLGSSSSIWRESNALIVGVAGVAVVTCVALFKKSQQGHIEGRTGEKSGLSALVLLLALLVIGGIASADAIRSGRRQNLFQTPPASGNANTASVQLDRGPFIRITPDTTNWTPLVVGRDMYIHWAVEGPGHVLTRFNNSPEQEDWAGQQVVTQAPVGPYTVFFKAKDANPVSLRVYVAPAR